MPAELTATSTATYDLMLLLDVAAEDGVRAGILKDVEGAIKGGGELSRHDRWGVRELAYPIMHKQQAEYHLFQFRPASSELLRGLDRTLSITDGVVRFRIVRLEPGTPEAPAPPLSAHSGPPAASQAAKGPGAAGESDPAEVSPDAHDDDEPKGETDSPAAVVSDAATGPAQAPDDAADSAPEQGATDDAESPTEDSGQ
ncbi:MAG: 30S ribosomal protein S6 [Solirubrobacteraceae bacterium]